MRLGTNQTDPGGVALATADPYIAVIGQIPYEDGRNAMEWRVYMFGKDGSSRELSTDSRNQQMAYSSAKSWGDFTGFAVRRFKNEKTTSTKLIELT